MTVNPEGTNAGEELLKALGGAEQEPTAEAEDEEDEAPEDDADGAEDGDEGDSEEDEADAEDGDEADEDTEKHTVKVAGEELKVTLQELKDGFMKDADYRRKTADIAETRKRVEAVEAQYTGGLNALEQQLEVVATFIAKQINVDDVELDKLAQENPAEFVKVQRQLAKSGNALQNVHNQLMAVRKAREDEANGKISEFRKAETAKLAEVNPELRKPENVQRLHSYLKDTFGLSKEEIDSVADHRFTLIAEKARRFDAMKAKAALKDKQVKTAPAKFQKGGTVQRNNSSKAKAQAFKKVQVSGKVNDLAALL